MGVQGCADGYIGDHISLAPSFVVTRIDIMEICTKVVKSIEELRQELISEGNL
ncbi:DEHA2E00132p [Debaryomyces hansenii CBS767]|uniref:DEHA2E00132p n=1 Tax=Debaryomyces hansenii (strain ATCC 36239 / CBS 767 / BCRC 21394 / JCM 1990 / NBRC 0083 / IGC 2968) TaxID=284592 RepID=B5RTS0_DEBHA|nr:DEHA2E00132p [Debaryomyces hansenii CBS767]CAR65732.1 DEHA2E00132p [Debaryomyces hansenii CBS767]|eukprot:XP_002770380.1 DEHA2E00132p [Debaryomyces hansenii CBS767]